MLPRRAAAFVLMLSLLLVPRAARAAWTWLPDDPGFPALTADPRESRFGFDVIEGARASGFAGKRFPLARIGCGKGAPAMHVTVDGMLWAWLLRQPHFNFALESVDGSFGLALDRTAGPWSARLRYGHVSSHLGDGEYDIEARRIAYSRESIALIGAYASAAGLRAYAGPSLRLHGTPRAPGLEFQVGGETRGALEDGQSAAPYAAFDFRLKAENAHRVNQSYQAGVRIGRVPGRIVRFALGYESGVSERGQAWRQAERFVRVGVTLGD